MVERHLRESMSTGDPASRDAQIRLVNLGKTYIDIRRNEKVVALEEFSLDIRPGEFITVLGPSGCGKSTLPDRGVVFQEYALFPWLTVMGNVLVGLKQKRLPGLERDRIARSYVSMAGLNGFEHKYPHELSGGMRQRVALIRALAIDPKILLMDEPFAAVDAQTRQVLQRELLKAWESTGKTIFFITHNVEEAIFLGQRVVVMTARPGRIKEIIDVNLPYIRDVSGEAFNAFRRRATKCMEAEVSKAMEAEGEGAVWDKA
jgi:NitT/TauT family transport system ATP-binding protein